MVHALEYPLLKRSGRLAQLVAHPLDVREVTSSSLVSSTKKTTPKGVVFCRSRNYSIQLLFALDNIKRANAIVNI